MTNRSVSIPSGWGTFKKPCKLVDYVDFRDSTVIHEKPAPPAPQFIKRGLIPDWVPFPIFAVAALGAIALFIVLAHQLFSVG